MTFSGFDAQFLSRLEKYSASPTQIYILQRIIRATEPQALLSQHATALAGIATEVPRAQAALSSHAETSQPHKNLLIALVNNARDSVDRVRQTHVTDQILTSLFDALDSGSSGLNLINSRAQLQLRTAALTIAQQVDPLMQKIPDQLSRAFNEVWEISEPTPQQWIALAVVADEVSCLIAAADRDSSALEWQIPTAFHLHEGKAEGIFKALLPDPIEYHVACVIRGAGKLIKLDALDPSAQQEQASDPDCRISWPGAPNNRLRKFIDKVSLRADDCVMSVEVFAVDRASAARLGRRQVTGILDQYTAGSRLIDLTIDPATLVARTGQVDTEEWQPPHRSARKVYPLLDFWPEGLREGLRTAHVARITDAPLTTAALSWVAMEACGLTHKDSGKLAQALSLQALRQQIAEAHQIILQSVSASLGSRSSEAAVSAGLVKSHQVGLTRLPSGYEQRRQELESLLQSAEERNSSAQRRLTNFKSIVSECLPTINRYAVVDTRNHLQNLNAWVDILLPARTAESADLVSARAALTALLPELSPLAARQIIDWTILLGDPQACADWLALTQSKMSTLLDALYSARNLALHNGVFTASGDEILGQGGVLVVDFVFEFLGNWYRNDPTSGPSKLPFEVVDELAGRQQVILNRLAGHSDPVYPLDVGFLTGQSATNAWGRI